MAWFFPLYERGFLYLCVVTLALSPQSSSEDPIEGVLINKVCVDTIWLHDARTMKGFLPTLDRSSGVHHNAPQSPLILVKV